MNFASVLAALQAMAGERVAVTVSAPGFGVLSMYSAVVNASPLQPSDHGEGMPHSWAFSMGGGEAGFVLRWHEFEAAEWDGDVLVIVMEPATYRVRSRASFNWAARQGLPLMSATASDAHHG